jgi:hypothetical protein
MFTFNYEKDFSKKDILLKSFKNMEKQYFYLHNNRNGHDITKKKLSISFPGYPNLKDGHIFSNTANIFSEEEMFFFTQTTTSEDGFLFENKNYLKNLGLSKKNNINPYSLYNFENYMNITFDNFKNCYIRNNIYQNESSNIMKEGELSSQETNELNLKELVIILNKKRFINLIIISFIYGYLKIEQSFLFKKIWDFFFITCAYKTLVIIFLKSNTHVYEKKTTFKHKIVKDIQNICFVLNLYYNGIARTSNLFSI